MSITKQNKIGRKESRGILGQKRNNLEKKNWSEQSEIKTTV
jgi:hypothetical protein